MTTPSETRAGKLLALADSWVPDGSEEEYTEFDRGYEQALDECATQLREALAASEPVEAVAWMNQEGDVTVISETAKAWERGGDTLTKLYTNPAPEQPGKGEVYQCPRCATSMEVDPTAKPSIPQPSDLKACEPPCKCGCRYFIDDACRDCGAPQPSDPAECDALHSCNVNCIPGDHVEPCAAANGRTKEQRWSEIESKESIFDIAQNVGAEVDGGERADYTNGYPGMPPTITFTDRQLEAFAAALSTPPTAAVSDAMVPPMPTCSVCGRWADPAGPCSVCSGITGALRDLLADSDRWLADGCIAAPRGTRTYLARERARAALTAALDPQVKK